MPKRQLIGTIISDKMQKTIVVNVGRVKEHVKYKKRYRVSKNYKAHVESGDYAESGGLKVGDKVLIEECKPISKDKKWRVVRKISAGAPPVEETPEDSSDLTEETAL